MTSMWTPAGGAGYWGGGPAFPIPCDDTFNIYAAAGPVTVKAGPGLLVEAVINSPGSGGDNLTIYDSLGAPSGNILAVIPGGTAAGTLLIINATAQNGITAVNVTGGPAVTLGFN